MSIVYSLTRNECIKSVTSVCVQVNACIFNIVFVCTSSCFWMRRRLVWNFRHLSSVSRAIYGLSKNPGSIEVERNLEQTKETYLHIHIHCQSLHLSYANNTFDCWYYKIQSMFFFKNTIWFRVPIFIYAFFKHIWMQVYLFTLALQCRRKSNKSRITYSSKNKTSKCTNMQTF